MDKYTNLKIPSFLAKKETATVVCLVTGISYDLKDVPALSSFFTFSHPLASPDNVMDFAKLPLEERKRCSPTILAGAVLSILHYWHLNDDRLSALEKNILLSTVSSKILLEALSFFSTISKRQSWRIPSFTFDPFKGYEKDKEKYCGIQPSFSSYLKECHATLYPTKEETAEEEITTAVYSLNVSKSGRTKVTQVTKEVKTQLRTAILALRISESISDKLAGKLNAITVGDNLYILEPEIRNSFISKLNAARTEENASNIDLIIRTLKGTDKDTIQQQKEITPEFQRPRATSILELLSQMKEEKLKEEVKEELSDYVDPTDELDEED